jgi:hypothetical protein
LSQPAALVNGGSHSAITVKALSHQNPPIFKPYHSRFLPAAAASGATASHRVMVISMERV